ncbi:MAG: hypothetical protein WD380_01435 [Gaiellaceae bacterium]
MATVDARAAKERKQKIFVVVGGVLLLAMMAFQLPKLLGGSSSSATPATETTAVGDPASTAAAAPASTQTSVALRDTDRPLAIVPGKLGSFTLFSKKDPFVQQAVTPAPSAGSAVTAGAGAPGKPETPVPSEGFTVGETPVAAVTVISVNGGRQALVPGAAFPASDPVFVLVAEQSDAKSVVIGIAGGGYESGAKTTKLRVGKPLVLVNTTTGARYRLVLVAVGSGSAASPIVTTGSATPTP